MTERASSSPSEPSSDPASTPPDADRAERARSYWVTNIRYLTLLLLVWGLVSFGCGILFSDYLNRFRLPGSGFPLGFWFAQQGSIYTFVVLIFVYVRLMNRLDRRHGVRES